MAQHLLINVEYFMRKYIRRVGNRLALIELKKREYDCVFLHDRRCLVYEVRPRQCRTFPWWKENLSNEHSWESVAGLCEGIGPQGKLVPFATIQRIVNDT
jgi:uncharacterized protein